VAHIARHDVTRRDVQQVCQGEFIASDTYKGRLRIVGPTRAGRMLAIILKPNGEGVYYCVTAHDANAGETRRYHELRETTI
jgi:uncharacterized DUF497 family protein